MSDVQTDEPISANRFVFAIGDPCSTDSPPRVELDPLAEIPPFRRAMYEFTQQHNRRVTVGVGGFERTVELADDIELVYEDLPRAVRCIAGGVAVRVSFYLSHFDLIVAPPGTPWEQAFEADGDVEIERNLAAGSLTLTPQHANALMECSIRKWGNDDLLTSVTLPTAQVIATLRGFLDVLIERAVAVGAIGAAEARAFLELCDG